MKVVAVPPTLIGVPPKFIIAPCTQCTFHIRKHLNEIVRILQPHTIDDYGAVHVVTANPQQEESQ